MAKGTRAVAKRNEKAKAKSRVNAWYSATRRETIGRAASWWLSFLMLPPTNYITVSSFISHHNSSSKDGWAGLVGWSACSVQVTGSSDSTGD
jgi:hypothetical protein